MYFLRVFLFNLVCFSVLSNGSAIYCQYTTDPQPQLYIDISGKHINATCITRETHNTNITFMKRDRIKLNCKRVVGTKPWYATVELQWKLEQFNQELLITEGIKIGKTVAGSNTLIMDLDRYDDGLIARCSSSGNERGNSIYVKFIYNKEKEGPDINTDIKNVSTTEGQMVRNEFANSVVLYSTPGNNTVPRVILRNDNIYDCISLEDNGAMYAGWENKSFDLRTNQTFIVKRKWVIHVEPANSESHLPILLGIGGISFLVIFTIIVVCCKYWRKKNENTIENPYAEVYEVAQIQPNLYEVHHPNPTPEETNYAEIPFQSERVVYAKMEMGRTDTQTPIQDSVPYAQIIGVIRP